jgi:hypothetical protein
MALTSEKKIPPSGDVTESIYIDPNLIPDHAKAKLAEATMGLLRRIYAMPNGKELLAQKAAEYSSKSV